MTTTIEEGGLYIISNFFTKEALGTLRPVSSKIIINFSPSTSVEKIKEDDFMIPFHKFEFVDLSELSLSQTLMQTLRILNIQQVISL